MTTFTIASAADWNADIAAIDQTGTSAAANTSYTFDIAQSFTLDRALRAINLDTGSTLTIEGNGNTIDGGGTYNGLFAYQGIVNVDSLTIADADAAGGNGGGGGGAGLGGGLFVAGPAVNGGGTVVSSGATVTLSGVAFAGDAATGGNGGAVGGGGGLLRGNGGAGLAGGGGGIGGAGGGAFQNGGTGLVPGAAGGGTGGPISSVVGGSGGASAGGGGGGAVTSFGAGGGGGGAGGSGGGSLGSGAGGFGGGSGYAPGSAGHGGFGGGGGGGGAHGGNGGWGGGGGGGTLAVGSGGFGGGAGTSADGGGGLGAGGDVFVQQGGVLVVQGGSLGTGTVAGGTGAHSGDAFGSGLFIQGDESVTLEGGAQPLVVAGTIADQNGAWINQFGTADSGASADGTTNEAVGTLVIGGGVVQLGTDDTIANTFAGPVVVDSGAALGIYDDAALGINSVGGVTDPNVLTLQAGSTLDLLAGFTLGHGIVLAGDPTFDLGTGTFVNDTSLISDGTSAGTLALTGGGTLELSDANSFSGGVSLEAGTLELGTAGAAGTGAITFGADPLLEFGLTAVPTNAIDDFFVGSTIEITNFTETGSTYVGSFLTLDGAGGPVTLDMPGIISNDLTIPPSVGNNTTITTDQPCFVQGTRILTARGETAVEALEVGDRVMALRGGGLRAVRWIGHRRVDVRRHPKPEIVRPMRIMAGAFGRGRPKRELWLSPRHAVYVDEVLIPVEALVNGATIVQVALDAVTYWHVELESHDVLLAEGLPVESYLDLGNRDSFANAGEHMVLYPDFLPKRWEDMCAPWLDSGPRVAAVKAWLLACAEAQGLVGRMERVALPTASARA